jgi:magnesium chelatase family protein
LRELILDLRGRRTVDYLATEVLPAPPEPKLALNLQNLPAVLQRLLWISAAGEHHLLVWGPRGVGKTHAAQFLADILPAPSAEDWELAQICHHRRALPPPERIPFRMLHSSTTKAGLIGGGASGLPGELSLANGGLLLLDELLEYKRETLECLRQVMESGRIAFARAQQNLILPARSLVYATTNTCPCGEGGSSERVCHCSPSSLRAYQRRLSHALADRFDLWWGWSGVEGVAALPADWQERIVSARQRMEERQKTTNGRMHGEDFKKNCELDPKAEKEWELLCNNEGMRTRQAILRVARTLADLHHSRSILLEHIREAGFYRLRKLLE